MGETIQERLRRYGFVEDPPLAAPPPVNGRRPQPDHPLVKGALQKRVADLAAMVPDSGRNDALNKAAAYLGRFPINRDELRTVLLDACQANGLLGEDGQRACDATISSGFKKADLDGPRTVDEPDIVELDTPACPAPVGGLADVEGDFWVRPSLKAVYDAALSRMCSPWAVLAHCTARVLTSVRPCVTLPALIGGPGSLNWYAAVAAASGGGKGSAASVARELVDCPVRERGMGSGEGMIGAFYKPGTKDTPPEVHEAVLFMADEIDAITALSSRTGSTMMSILRQGFTGETLGFSYIAKGRDVHVDAHTYRMAVIFSVQPARAGALLGDHGGGTPQRFMWFPGTDARVVESPDGGDFLQPLLLPAPGEWQYPRTLVIPDEARRLILSERAKGARGELDALDGHAVFCREKFAFALAVLDNRTQMAIEDWELSGIAARVSEQTRLWVGRELLVAADREAAERGRLLGVQFAASDDEKTYLANKRTSRLARWAMEKLEEGPVTNRELTQACSSRDRAWLAGALQGLVNAGLIGKDGQKRWMKIPTS